MGKPNITLKIDVNSLKCAKKKFLQAVSTGAKCDGRHITINWF